MNLTKIEDIAFKYGASEHKRKDLVNWIYSVVETLIFFNKNKDMISKENFIKKGIEFGVYSEGKKKQVNISREIVFF